MPRHSSLPTLYDECKTIDLSFLKKWGYLKPGQWKSGGITWSRAGNKTGSISFSVDMLTHNHYLELDYRSNEIPRKYQIQLVSILSNIGKGRIWYFLCPSTGKRCRKLYLVGGYFLHRTAFKGCFYEKQTYSRRNRSLCKLYETSFGCDKAYETIYSKYFKTHYAGRPTRRYRKMMKMISDSRQINESEIEQMIYRK